MTLTLWVRVGDNFALTSRYVCLRSGLDTSFSRPLQEIIQEKYYQQLFAVLIPTLEDPRSKVVYLLIPYFASSDLSLHTEFRPTLLQL